MVKISKVYGQLGRGSDREKQEIRRDCALFKISRVIHTRTRTRLCACTVHKEVKFRNFAKPVYRFSKNKRKQRCAFSHTHTHTRAHTVTNTHVIQAYTQTHTRKHTYMHTQIYTCTRARTHSLTHTRHTSTRTHTQTHEHTRNATHHTTAHLCSTNESVVGGVVLLAEGGESGQREDDEGSGQGPCDGHCPHEVQTGSSQQGEEPK